MNEHELIQRIHWIELGSNSCVAGLNVLNVGVNGTLPEERSRTFIFPILELEHTY